jgi:hypothetical protein
MYIRKPNPNQSLQIMELIQVNWDEYEHLFLKFKKENEKLNPYNVKRINLQYNIIKIDQNSRALKAPPFWFSTENAYFTEDAVGIAVELEEIQNYDSLQIELIKLKIVYKSGNIEHISINEKFPLAEIFTNDACYLDFPKDQKIQIPKTSTEITFKQKQSIKITTMDLVDFEKEYHPENKNRDSEELSVVSQDAFPIPISKENYEALMNIKGDKSWSALMFIIRELFVRLNYVEQELRESNATLREVALKNAEALCNRPNYIPPPPPGPSQLMPPQSAIGPPKRKLAIGTQTKLITDKSSISLQAHTAVIKEMQEKFVKISNVKELLKKVPEKILNRDIPRTDRLAFLEFKERQTEENE